MTLQIKHFQDFLNKKQVLVFFLLVFLLSTPLWIIELFIDIDKLPLNIPITDILAAFTPLLSACLLTYKEEGQEGVRRLLFRIGDFKKINLTWRLTMLAIPIIIFSCIYILLYVNHYPIPDNWNVSSYATIPFLLIFFYFGAIGEEVGYMGYAVDRLQGKYSAFWASIAIGIPWIVWHYPSILQQGRNLNFIFWGTLGTIAFRTIYVWLYNNTNRSLSACIVVHCLYNTGRVLFPSNTNYNPLVDYPAIHYSVIVVFALVVTIFWGMKTLNHFTLFSVK